jgi:hypothetical protein
MKQDLQGRMFLFSPTWDYVHQKHALLLTLAILVYVAAWSPRDTLSRTEILCTTKPWQPSLYGTRSTLHLIPYVVPCHIFIGRVWKEIYHTQTSSKFQFFMVCAYSEPDSQLFSVLQLCTSDVTSELVALVFRRSRVRISAQNPAI